MNHSSYFNYSSQKINCDNNSDNYLVDQSAALLRFGHHCIDFGVSQHKVQENEVDYDFQV